MKSCSRCNNSSSDNAAFCSVCGAPMPVMQIAPTYQVPTTAKSPIASMFWTIGGILAIILLASGSMKSNQPEPTPVSSSMAADTPTPDTSAIEASTPIDTPTPDDMVDVELEVIVATGSKRSITYSNANGDTEQDTDGQGTWKKKFKAHKGDRLYVSGQNGDEYGGIVVYIWINNAEARRSEGSGGYCIATATYEVPN